MSGFIEAEQPAQEKGNIVEENKTYTKKQEFSEESILDSNEDAWKDEAVSFIADFEGFSETCKYDNKQNSWGYGTKCTHIGATIDRDTAMEYKKQHLQAIYELVDDSCYTDAQKIVLTSYIYNVGRFAMNISEYVKRCDKDSVLYIMSSYGWTAGGQRLRGLEKRRKIEIAKFNGINN